LFACYGAAMGLGAFISVCLIAFSHCIWDGGKQVGQVVCNVFLLRVVYYNGLTRFSETRSMSLWTPQHYTMFLLSSTIVLPLPTPLPDQQPLNPLSTKSFAQLKATQAANFKSLPGNSRPRAPVSTGTSTPVSTAVLELRPYYLHMQGWREQAIAGMDDECAEAQNVKNNFMWPSKTGSRLEC
jgi:hypothetical protein